MANKHSSLIVLVRWFDFCLYDRYMANKKQTVRTKRCTFLFDFLTLLDKSPTAKKGLSTCTVFKEAATAIKKL